MVEVVVAVVEVGGEEVMEGEAESTAVKEVVGARKLVPREMVGPSREKEIVSEALSRDA